MNTLDTLVSRFRKVIQEEIEEERYSVALGNAEDIVAYKKICARIEGLERALSYFDTIVSKLQTDEEEGK